MAAVSPLLEARKAMEQQIDDLDRKVLKLARHDAQVGGIVTTPGIGPVTALCFKATIDDPTRFGRSRSVGAYVGLTTRRHASGEFDRPAGSQSAVTPCSVCISSKRQACC
jgi:transposase